MGIDSRISSCIGLKMQNKSLINRAFFISFVNQNYSRTGVFFSERPNFKITSSFIQVEPGFFRSIRSLWIVRNQLRNKKSIIVVMSPCHILVPILKCITDIPIVLDAGWPLSDSRKDVKKFSKIIKAIKSWLIDFVAFHKADIVILESQSQIQHVSEKWLVNKDKLRSIFTGFNEELYLKVAKDIYSINKNVTNLDKNYLLFRGKYTPEAGLENIAGITRQRNFKSHVVIHTNFIPKNIIFGKRTTVILDYISEAEIGELYKNSLAVIGQVSNSARLNRTIPHKAFEAAFFSKPYITTDNAGLREFLSKDNQAFYIEHSSVKMMANRISAIVEQKDELNLTSLRIKTQYERVANQGLLRNQFYQILDELFS